MKSLGDGEVPASLDFVDRLEPVHRTPQATLVLLRDLGFPNRETEARLALDALLLLFDQLLLPDLPGEHLSAILGERKYATLKSHGVVKTVDLAGIYDGERGLLNIKAGETSKDWDFVLSSNLRGAPSTPDRPGENAIKLRNLIDNLAYVYEREVYQGFRHLPSDAQRSLTQPSKEDEFGFLVKAAKVTGPIVIRAEIASRLFSSTLLLDGFYGSVNRVRETYYSVRRGPNHPIAEVFKTWLRSSRFELRELSAEQILDFKSRGLSLTPIVEMLIRETRSNAQNASTLRELAGEVAERLDEMILRYKRLQPVNHNARAAMLTGVLNTLGSILGGTGGAILGGVGGALLAHLALEYDRRVPPPVSFLLEHVVR